MVSSALLSTTTTSLPLPPPWHTSKSKQHLYRHLTSCPVHERTHFESYQQLVPGSAKDRKRQQSDCKPRRTLTAKGTQLVKHSNCLNHFLPLHATPDGRKWGEVSYTQKQGGRSKRPKGRWNQGVRLSRQNSCVWFAATHARDCYLYLVQKVPCPLFTPMYPAPCTKSLFCDMLSGFCFPEWTLARRAHNASQAYFKRCVSSHLRWHWVSSESPPGLQPYSGLCWAP